MVAAMTLAFSIEAEASVKLGQYKGLHYNEVEKQVTDDDVKNEIDKKFSSTTEYQQITDRKIAGFDKVNVDYDLYCEGEKVDEKHDVKVDLGSDGLGTVLNKLIGESTGESIEIASNLPDDWEDKEIAGKSVLFEVTVNYICGDAIAQVYDDNWVKEHTKFSTVADYEKAVRDRMEKENKEKFNKAVHDELVSEVITNATFDDDTVTDAEYSEAVNSYKDYAEAEGLDYNEFIQEYLGVAANDVEHVIREDILYNKKVNEAFNQIAANENIVIDSKSWESYLEKVASDYGYDDTSDLENDLEDDNELKQSLEQECLNQLVYQFVFDNAVNDA